MKSNWIKYVFIVFIIIVLVFAVIKIRNDEKEEELESQTTNSEDEKVREIKVGIASLDTINPILSTNKNVQDITKLIYEPLVNITSDYKAEPCLATEWAKEENSYLIKLRENVKWSDGLRFTAEDVRFTIDRLKEVNSIYSYNVQHVVGVDIVDDYTVRINLDGEVPFFEYNLIFPILSKDYFEGEDFVNTEKNSSPVGTGKYKITAVDGSAITLEKNNNWWNQDTELIDYQIEDELMLLNFNHSIFSQDKVLEEVSYSIAYSVFDNYDVNTVLLEVEGIEVGKIEKGN